MGKSLSLGNETVRQLSTILTETPRTSHKQLVERWAQLGPLQMKDIVLNSTSEADQQTLTSDQCANLYLETQTKEYGKLEIISEENRYWG